MKRTLALWVFLASCEPLDTVQDHAKADARAAFEWWKERAAAGSAEDTFKLMSDSYKSQWIFERLQASDPVVLAWRRELTGAPREILDLWWEHFRRNPQPRVETLRREVLGHPSIAQPWKDCFAQDLNGVKYQMSRLEVSEVYADALGVTVRVRNAYGRPELYEMVLEGEQWRINHHMDRIRELPR